MSSPSQCSAMAMVPSFPAAAAHAAIPQAAVVNKDGIRRCITRSQPTHRLGALSRTDGGGALVLRYY